MKLYKEAFVFRGLGLVLVLSVGKCMGVFGCFPEGVKSARGLLVLFIRFQWRLTSDLHIFVVVVVLLSFLGWFRVPALAFPSNVRA